MLLEQMFDHNANGCVQTPVSGAMIAPHRSFTLSRTNPLESLNFGPFFFEEVSGSLFKTEAPRTSVVPARFLESLVQMPRIGRISNKILHNIRILQFVKFDSKINPIILFIIFSIDFNIFLPCSV